VKLFSQQNRSLTGCYEHGNVLSNYTKKQRGRGCWGKKLGHLSAYLFIENDSISWHELVSGQLLSDSDKSNSNLHVTAS
jgi:hypothetical protein